MATYRVTPSGDDGEITQEGLDKLNVSQATKENKGALDELGSLQGLAAKLRVNLQTGLTEEQAVQNRAKYGANFVPTPPMATLIELFLDALKDPILIILIGASIVSLVIGILEEPENGWIEGTAIMIAILIVATVTSTNNYNKERQFRALEEASRKDERVFVKRGGELKFINPDEIVIGDLVKLKAGDGIPADGVLAEGEGVKSNESSLTGEPDDLSKTLTGDPFLLSGCLLTDQGTSPEVYMLTIAVGARSQYGKIRAKLQEDPAETPLQEKLAGIATLVGKIGTGVALATFAALVISIWVKYDKPSRNTIVGHIVEAFIIAVTIIVVAIPEGLPLAVTISLAYSTKKMYKDQNLIRVLSACETMGNATNICSDKTGTLTENRMTVVEGWFGGVVYNDMKTVGPQMNATLKDHLAVNAAVNSAANVIFIGEDGKPLFRPKIVGSATEGALLLMVNAWGMDFSKVKDENFNKNADKVYPFNSGKKRATAIVNRPDGTVRIYVKGATEWVLNDAVSYTTSNGTSAPLTEAVRKQIADHVYSMADRALRTLCIGHRDFPSLSKLPDGWQEDPPDRTELIVDGIVGIIDPLREDVKEAVKTAQNAGVMVRMVTGDNINTAKAIARDCGILTAGGLAIEGPTFRGLTPAQVDEILPRIQVMARSSPEDKYLMVTRLNGANLPKNEKEWLEKHPGHNWETEKDLLLPGYVEEWEKTRPDGGQVVGVTGDGTNDAPALKAGDVGLAMGITGTQVAKNASKIVILDDKFSSIVKAIMWGRCVYDNIRKFLQFQLTVNLVALILVFVGSVAGFAEPPLNAVMMLWVNLIMDAMGALALGTEEPTRELLERKPYKRSASLISWPMWRNIVGQALYQLGMLFFLLFEGPKLWHLHSGNFCEKWNAGSSSKSFTLDNGQAVTCGQFTNYCNTNYGGDTGVCFEHDFESLGTFADECKMTCNSYDYTHFSFIFTAFVLCQVFNEFNARELHNKVNILRGVVHNPIFIAIVVITGALQFMIVMVGGDWVKTSPLNGELWGWSILFGSFSWPLGFFLRVAFPLKENPKDFFGYEMPNTPQPIPPHLEGKVHQGDQKVAQASDGHGH